jgi:hypothetical protein
MPTPASDVAFDLVFLLAPPRSFTTVVSSMLGQHPQLYGLPEMLLRPIAPKTLPASCRSRVRQPSREGGGRA